MQQRPSASSAAVTAACLGFLSLGEAALAIDDSGSPGLPSAGVSNATGRLIEEIVIVAHKQPRSARDVAASVATFSAADLRLELGASMADMFRYSPGIDFASAGNRFGYESINIRGIDGNRVAVLLDGVPISDHFSVGNFSNASRDLVSAGFAEQVEVLFGPASTLYGSSAIGGVVAMRSPDARRLAGDNAAGGQFFTNAHDSDSSVQATALQSVVIGPVSLLGGLSAQGGEEFEAAAVAENVDERDVDGRSGIMKLSIDDALGNVWTAGLYHQRTQVDSALQSMLGSGRFRSTTALQGHDESRTDIASLTYDFRAEGIVDSGVLRLYYQNTDIHQETYDERAAAARPVSIDREFSFGQKSHGFEANLLRLLSAGSQAHQIGFGLEYQQRESREVRDGLETGLQDGLVSNALLGEIFPLRDFPISETVEWGAYLEDTVSIGRWSLIAGLRADWYDMQPEPDAMYVEDYPFANPVSITEFEVSPKLGGIFRISDTVELWIQYAHGFRAPPFEDANISLELPLFNIRAIPNPDLRAERSDGIDVGLRWRGDTFSGRLSVFRTRYGDFIESRVRAGQDPDTGRILFQAQNIDQAQIEGVDAGVTIVLDSWITGLSFDASLFAARGEDRTNGESLNSVGPPQAVTTLGWTSAAERWSARLRTTITARWSERDETAGPLFKPQSNAISDFFIAYRPSDRLTLRAGVLNLTDQIYWSWSAVRGLSPDDPVLPYLSRPGRSVSLGLDWSW